MVINWLTLIVALILSTVAGYFSIVGLATIFSASFWQVVIMGGSLELAKVVATSWLYRNWEDVTNYIKYYLIAAIVILSFITSLGVFGYLSKAHVEQSTVSSDVVIKLNTINQQISIENKRLQTLLNQYEKYDGPIRRLENDIKETQNRLSELNKQKLPLLQEQNKLSAEVGPLKYIAEMVYGSSDESTLNSATRGVIILLVIVFDPLALCLLIAANSSIRSGHGLKTKKGKRIVEIDPKSIMKI